VRSRKLYIRIMEGKKQWSVKVFCNRKILMDQIDEISTDAAILEEKIMASSPGKAYLLQRKKAELVRIEMTRICYDFSQSCLDKFRNMSDSCIMNTQIPATLPRIDNALILNISLLVSGEKVNKLKGISDTLQKDFASSGFFIETSGPFPPCNFAE
jgi:hypothetical protein